MIGDSAFNGCISLTNIVIPDSIISIGAWAFSCCHNLTHITIPQRVKEVKWMAFNNCSHLNNVYCKAIIPPKVVLRPNCKYLFQSTPLNAIYVPRESIYIYKEAEGWNEYRDKIQPFDF